MNKIIIEVTEDQAVEIVSALEAQIDWFEQRLSGMHVDADLGYGFSIDRTQMVRRSIEDAASAMTIIRELLGFK